MPRHSLEPQAAQRIGRVARRPHATTSLAHHAAGFAPSLFGSPGFEERLAQAFNLAGELFGGWAPLHEVSKVHQQFLERAEERPFEREGRERSQRYSENEGSVRRPWVCEMSYQRSRTSALEGRLMAMGPATRTLRTPLRS